MYIQTQGISSTKMSTLVRKIIVKSASNDNFICQNGNGFTIVITTDIVSSPPCFYLGISHEMSCSMNNIY